MHWIRSRLPSYHPVVWWMIGGTFLSSFTRFMVMPFLALYMATHTHAHASTIDFVIGASALTSTSLGFVGGTLADRFGRKPLMAIAMAITTIAMAIYPSAGEIIVFLGLSVCGGLSRSLFQPSSQAVLTDFTPSEKRADVFALRYWALNLAGAVGPLVGAYFGTVATGWTFYLAACSNFVYFLIVVFVVPGKRSTTQNPAHEQSGTPAPKFSFRNTIRIVLRDKALLFFLVAGFFSNIGYSQIDSNLPQKMAHVMSPAHAANVFAIVAASNAIEVVVLQLPVMKLVKRISLAKSMMAGQTIFALGYLAMAFSSQLWSYLVAMLIITTGEIIVFPQNSKYIAELAHPEMRASYFGASSFVSLGFFLGPWLGGSILAMHDGGTILFALVACVVAIGVPFYHWSDRMRSDPAKTDVEISIAR